jgi:RNA polymerase sigma-70 factor, ECF subfamily
MPESTPPIPEEEIIPYTLTPEGEKLLSAAQSLRRVLSHYARSERDGVTLLRPPDPSVVKTVAAMAASGFDVALVDDLLDEFEEISERGCHVFEMHFFAGVALVEIASEMQIPLQIAERDWSIAKAWLYEHLKKK